MVFKAAVVTVVCLLQSPTTTEALAASGDDWPASRQGGGGLMTKLLDAPSVHVRTGGPSRRRARAGARAPHPDALLTSPKYGPVTGHRPCSSSSCSSSAACATRGFLSGQVVLNLLVDNSYLIVLAVGMTFVILTGGIDLSVGAVVALSAA